MDTRAKIMVVVTIVIAFLLTPIMFDSVWAVDCPIPDTGQSKCYDDIGNEINPCPSLGQSFYGQDAQHPCNPQSYTRTCPKLANFSSLYDGQVKSSRHSGSKTASKLSTPALFPV